MKVNLVKKFKWYIVGFIMSVILLSAGLSFCTWDYLSIQALKAKANTGGYDTMYKLANDNYSNDYFTKGKNGIANIGDIVTFGKYFQNANDAKNKTPLRWIVVENKNAVLTLLAESVVAFGSFWGTWCYTSSDGTWGKADWAASAEYQTYYQNYEQSTLRAWLNSYSLLRNDGGTNFSSSSEGVFTGFLSEAFTGEEQEYILSKEISGIYGSKKAAKDDAVNDELCEYYKTANDKIWTPSYSEIFGKTTEDWWKGKNDGLPNTQFRYFADNDISKRRSKSTAFAASNLGNYTFEGATTASDNWQSISAGEDAWWWLRSPYSSSYASVLFVYNIGTLGFHFTAHSFGGVRPAVCVPL